ncbi:hypothetical protein EB796_005908 [Bugula neritina]|uniref:Uncharacterized protein n=1 Tax=Bugula neritina TaxID=10212 RepID=A0A7J7KAV0_BUGNE|nr:hypothetical protein EB796_005908 [Bugula neritina]
MVKPYWLLLLLASSMAKSSKTNQTSEASITPLAQQQSIPTAAMKHLNLNEPAVADTSQPQQLIQPTPTQQLSQPNLHSSKISRKTQCISKPKGVTGTP